MRNEPFNLEGDRANLLSLTQGGSSYRINVRASAGSSQASFDGTFVPFKLETIDGQLKLNGKDLSNLYPMIPIALPWTPPYSIAGRLIRDGDKWSPQKVTGKIGASDLSGDLASIAVASAQRLSPIWFLGDLTTKIWEVL